MYKTLYGHGLGVYYANYLLSFLILQTNQHYIEGKNTKHVYANFLNKRCCIVH